MKTTVSECDSERLIESLCDMVELFSLIEQDYNMIESQYAEEVCVKVTELLEDLNLTEKIKP